MTTYLLSSASVHTSAAACDHLVDRLAPATVWTERREGEPAGTIFDLAAEIDADELLVGQRRGDPEADGLGSTAVVVAGEVTRPVVVVPT